jgi:hypothetical protein
MLNQNSMRFEDYGSYLNLEEEGEKKEKKALNCFKM